MYYRLKDILHNVSHFDGQVTPAFSFLLNWSRITKYVAIAPQYCELVHRAKKYIN